MLWRACAKQNGQGASRSFSTLQESNPTRPTICNLQQLHTALSFSDCSSWISRPDTKYQNSWTQTLDWSYRTWHRLDSHWSWNIFHFAQILLNAHRATHWLLKKWELRTWSYGWSSYGPSITSRSSYGHCLQAFARSHLKLLCCLIQIWADSLSSDRSLT